MVYYFYLDRGISSVGRATGWQPVGQRFEPAILHLKDAFLVNRVLFLWRVGTLIFFQVSVLSAVPDTAEYIIPNVWHADEKQISRQIKI